MPNPHLETLKQKTLALPLAPGVYLMKDAQGNVIYVGKAKALKNRVTSYFRSDKQHTRKTMQLVAKIVDFDIIVTQTEFEALVLENAMIKKYMPKYNILLKDDKGYPFIKVTTSQKFPTFQVVGKPAADADRYFGPYASRRTAWQVIDTISRTFGLKSCTRVFPRDIGKGRPCLNAHMGRCVAPCTGEVTSDEYRALVQQGTALLEGNFSALVTDLTAQMEQAAEALAFERAALLRDRIKAIRTLGERQRVVAGSFTELDVVAFVQGQTRGCIVVLHYLGGNLQDKDFTLLDGTSAEEASEALSAFLKQYYALRQSAPKTVLLSHEIDDIDAISEYLSKTVAHKVALTIPQRGRKNDLMRLAERNATEEITRVETAQEKQRKSIELLSQMVGSAVPLHTMEAYDISNFGGVDTVGSMVVFTDGKPQRSRYRRFKIRCEQAQGAQNDYASMEEMLTRRLTHWKEGDPKFCPLPDVLMIDGGLGHVRIARTLCDKFGADILCLGMVKDDKHRTRGLMAPDGREFGITTVPAVFALIGRMQEEVHRFAIAYNRQLGSKRVRGSSLDGIAGVGEKRRNALLKHFGSVDNIKHATLEELRRVVPENVAQAVFAQFKI